MSSEVQGELGEGYIEFPHPLDFDEMHGLRSKLAGDLYRRVALKGPYITDGAPTERPIDEESLRKGITLSQLVVETSHEERVLFDLPRDQTNVKLYRGLYLPGYGLEVHRRGIVELVERVREIVGTYFSERESQGDLRLEP